MPELCPVKQKSLVLDFDFFVERGQTSRALVSSNFVSCYFSAIAISFPKARRWYFTIDEALAEVLEEENDFLFGTTKEESSDEDGGDPVGRQATLEAQRKSSAAELHESGCEPEEELASKHFLDRETGTEIAA